MKINKVEAWTVEMWLDESYAIAYETVEYATNIFLHVETNKGPGWVR